MTRLLEIISSLKNNDSKLIFKTEQNSLEITRSRPKRIIPASVNEPLNGNETLPLENNGQFSVTLSLEQEYPREPNPPEAERLENLITVSPAIAQPGIPPAPPPPPLPKRPPRFTCEYCAYSTDRKNNYNKHLRCVHFKEKFLCQICYKRFSNLPQHMRVTHLTSKTKLDAKIRSDKHPETSGTPDKNAQIQYSKDSRTTQVTLGHETDIGKHLDQQEQILELDKNEARSDKDPMKKVKCESKKKLCEACDKWYSNYEQHVKIVHKKIKNFECVNCKKRFYDNRELRNHHLKSLQTGQCQQQLAFNTEHRKHKCSQCDYRTNLKTNLTLHIESVHLKIKHACSGCGIKLSSKSNLNNHMKNCKVLASLNRVERDPKRILFQCKLCDYSTPRPSHLDRHILSVHKTEAFQTVTSVYEASTRPGTSTPMNNSRIPFKLPQFVNLVNFDSIEGINFDNFFTESEPQTSMEIVPTSEPVSSTSTNSVITEVYTFPQSNQQINLEQPSSSQQNSNYKSSLKITLQDLDVHDLDGIDLMPFASEGDPENEKRTTEMVTQLMDILTGCESQRPTTEEKLGSCIQNM